jgi:hypothetical protein
MFSFSKEVNSVSFRITLAHPAVVPLGFSLLQISKISSSVASSTAQTDIQQIPIIGLVTITLSISSPFLFGFTQKSLSLLLCKLKVSP